ncbi:MAG: UV DNA damage repair endonuclease UvsE [Planctomycetaceae bacterium]|nr:UV DNA damage repair endonuclease UvsE [Planctomycetales bacterium]MCB9921872.1 UV DNA damage repair endonuclease UvsE [Planctomycetaceae bacterium]
MDCCGADALPSLGFDRNGTATKYHLDELRRGTDVNSVTPSPTVPRLGLCCTFSQQPIRFRTTTVKANSGMKRELALAKLSELCLANADALLAALHFCATHGIGSFRINSQILPLKTHSACGYSMNELPRGEEIVERFRACGEFAKTSGIRTCLHPDQFVVLNSPRADVVTSSVAELEYQSEVAEWVGADVVNIHGGGAYGNKAESLNRLAMRVNRLSERSRSRLTLENDDTTYTPNDLLPLCQAEGIPLVYDVHHHRCNRDELSVEEATRRAVATWNREPLFHISSPLEGWKGKNPKPHHDFIDIQDFPQCWRDLSLTVEVEAKAKEVAVLKLKRQLVERWFVYILRCVDGSLYTGITNNLSRRLDQHNSGTASRYTRGRLPVVMIYYEEQPDQGSALRRELDVKAMSRSAKEFLAQSTPGVSIDKG